MSDESPRGEAAPSLDRIRHEPRVHAVSVATALVVGLLLASVHWIGLVAVGALVALVAPSFRRGVVYAFGAGVLALVVFAALLGPAAPALFGMWPVVYVTVASGVGLPLLGALARGVW